MKSGQGLSEVILSWLIQQLHQMAKLHINTGQTFVYLVINDKHIYQVGELGYVVWDAGIPANNIVHVQNHFYVTIISLDNINLFLLYKYLFCFEYILFKRTQLLSWGILRMLF